MKILLIILILAVAGLLIVFAPLAVIWALNTLLSLGIPYTLKTWAAVVVLNLTWFYKPSLKLPKN